MNDKIKDLLSQSYKTYSTSKNKWRIENREQLREQRKKELKELIEKHKEMSNNKQQTSVEYLVEQLFPKALSAEQYYHIEQAKAMHKEEIENAQMDMFIHLNELPYSLEYLEKRQSAEDFANQYYNETFGQ